MGDSLASYDDAEMDDAPDVSASQEAALAEYDEDDRREDALATGPAQKKADGPAPGEEEEAGGRNAEPAAAPVRAADAPQEAPPVDKTKWLEEFVTKVALEKGWTVTATAADLIFTEAADLATKGFKWIGHILDDGATRLTVAMVQKALKADEEEDYEVGPECSRDDFVGVEPVEPVVNNDSQQWGDLDLAGDDDTFADGGKVGAYLGADDSEDSGDEEFAEQKKKSGDILKEEAALSVELDRLSKESQRNPAKTFYVEKKEEGAALETKEERKAAFVTLKMMKTMLESPEYQNMYPEQHEVLAEMHRLMAREAKLPGIIAEKNVQIERLRDLYEERKEEEERAKTNKKREKLKRAAEMANPVDSGKKRAKAQKALEHRQARLAKK